MLSRLIVWVNMLTGAIRIESAMSAMTPRLMRAAPPKPMRRAGSAIAHPIANSFGPNSSTAVSARRLPDGRMALGGHTPASAPPSTTSMSASQSGDVQ